jgi:nucleoside-diphosphate-sugar epimerase
MRVLILGASGYLGPHVISALQDHHELVATDVLPITDAGVSRVVDIADPDQVLEAASGTDAIINCSVQRSHRRTAFDVNTRGTFHALMAAVVCGHRRFINTGPRFTLVGPAYLDWDFDIPEEIPPHPGTDLYAMSKSLGHDLCGVFAAAHQLHVLTLLFSSFCEPEAPAPDRGGGCNSFAVSFRDAAAAVRLALEVDLSRVPSRCETFFVTTGLPHGVCSGDKARRVLGWSPQDDLQGYWRGGQEPVV